MQDFEAKKILMALDGLAAYLETIRNLIVSSITQDEPEEESKAATILRLIPNALCLHENSIAIETLGGSSRLCNDCSEQF